MKALRKLFQPAPIALVLELAVIALFNGACYDARDEQDGDGNPKYAQFRVSVQPDTVTFDAQNHSATVTITGACVGKGVPNPCGDVNWEIFQNDVSHVTARFVGDIKSYTTTLEVTADWEKAVSELLSRPSSLRQESSSGKIYFKPNLQGEGSFDIALAGTLFVVVKLVVPNAPPDQQDQVADKPRLTVTQNRSFPLNPNDESKTLFLFVNYSGPPNTLTVGDPADKGVSGGAAKFTVVSPQTIALPGDGTQPPPIAINFKVDKTDYQTYTAALFVSVDNARPVPVNLSGTRYRF